MDSSGIRNTASGFACFRLVLVGLLGLGRLGKQQFRFAWIADIDAATGLSAEIGGKTAAELTDRCQLLSKESWVLPQTHQAQGLSLIHI